jgi:hypothetical protein
MKVFIMQLSAPSRDFIPLRPKHSYNSPVLKIANLFFPFSVLLQ